jgi:hypothetical protein
MKTINLTGMSELDLNNKQWSWQTNGTKKTIVKQWPDELLPLQMRAPMRGKQILFREDRLSRKIDYEED